MCAAVATTGAVVLVTACAARAPVDPQALDQRIALEVRTIAADVEQLEIDELDVRVQDGVVVLAGVQSSWEAVSELLDRVTRLQGVREVDNRIRVIRQRPLTAP